MPSWTRLFRTDGDKLIEEVEEFPISQSVLLQTLGQKITAANFTTDGDLELVLSKKIESLLRATMALMNRTEFLTAQKKQSFSVPQKLKRDRRAR